MLGSRLAFQYFNIHIKIWANLKQINVPSNISLISYLIQHNTIGIADSLPPYNCPVKDSKLPVAGNTKVRIPAKSPSLVRATGPKSTRQVMVEPLIGSLSSHLKSVMVLRSVQTPAQGEYYLYVEW